MFDRKTKKKEKSKKLNKDRRKKEDSINIMQSNKTINENDEI
jgi:hypothetical protein